MLYEYNLGIYWIHSLKKDFIPPPKKKNPKVLVIKNLYSDTSQHAQFKLHSIIIENVYFNRVINMSFYVCL